jgi:hypothetical protein
MAAAAMLAGCATGFEKFQAPAFSIAQATAMTDEQAKTVISGILRTARQRLVPDSGARWPASPRFYEGWPNDPVVRTPPMCEEILGYDVFKKIGFENLEFGYADEEFVVFSVFTDFAGAGCSDKPRGQFVWNGVSPAEAGHLSEAFYELGAKPRKARAN